MEVKLPSIGVCLVVVNEKHFSGQYLLCSVDFIANRILTGTSCEQVLKCYKGPVVNIKSDTSNADCFLFSFASFKVIITIEAGTWST